MVAGNAVTLCFQRFAGLGSGIVEFAGLTDNNRTGAYNHYAFNIVAFGHS